MKYVLIKPHILGSVGKIYELDMTSTAYLNCRENGVLIHPSFVETIKEYNIRLIKEKIG